MSKTLRWKFKVGQRIRGQKPGRKSIGRVIAHITEDRGAGQIRQHYKIYWVDISEFREHEQIIIETFYDRVPESKKGKRS